MWRDEPILTGPVVHTKEPSSTEVQGLDPLGLRPELLEYQKHQEHLEQQEHLEHRDLWSSRNTWSTGNVEPSLSSLVSAHICGFL